MRQRPLRTMKLGVIGCGAFARQFHGPAQQRCAAEMPDLELTACCDLDPPRARNFAAAFGFARAYADAAQMLAAERPDAVIIAVPPELTGATATPVLERGYAVLLEKPPGISLPELGQLITAAEKGGARVQVGFNRHHMPVMRRAREILEREFAATPVTRIDYQMMRHDRWDRDFSTTAIHAIDAVRFLARSPFRTLRLERQPIAQSGREAAALSLALTCVSGVQVQLEIHPVTGRNHESATVHAVGQSLAIHVPFPGKSSAQGTVEHWRADERVTSWSDAGGDLVERMGIVDETKSFLAAVRDRAAVSPGLRDCYQQVELMELIRSRREGLIEIQSQ